MPDQTELTNKNQTLSSKKSIQGWEGFKPCDNPGVRQFLIWHTDKINAISIAK
jgi:hypothetical protein